MLKDVIVAYDGSPLAREAFAYGLMLAKAARTRVVAIQCLEPEPPGIAMADPAAGFGLENAWTPEPEDVEAERRRATAALSELRGFCDEASVPFQPRVEEGDLLDVLKEAADPTDLVAVGMRGRFAHAGLGSTTAELVKNGPCPVMVVSGPLRDVGRLLCVYDGSGACTRAIGWSREAASQTGWPLTVLAVSGRDKSLEAALAEAQELAPEGQVIHYGPGDDSEARQIETAAEKTRTALLVMGAFAEGWLQRLLFGGTTDQVLSRVDAPVVLVP